MKKEIFKGIGTAIITPFNKGKVDYVALECLLEKQLNAGTDAIIVLGTTGEPCTIKSSERKSIIKYVTDKCKNKCSVIVGCGSNNTESAIKMYKQAEAFGADGALIVSPYYNKCTQNGIVEYYKKISESGNLPIIVYNVPSRTGVNILPETMIKLCEIENICGIKEASGNIGQIMHLFKLIENKVAIYSGDDMLNNIFCLLGGMGSISVLSNIAPILCKRIDKLCRDGKLFDANKIHMDLFDLTKNLFSEVNPIPIKAGLAYLGLCKNELRRPLTCMEKKNFEVLKKEIDKVYYKYDCL